MGGVNFGIFAFFSDCFSSREGGVFCILFFVASKGSGRGGAGLFG